jgi:hypothetical protein
MSRGLIVRIAIVIAVLIAMVGARVLYLQRSHFLKAEGHYAQGELKLAVREYSTAMSLYVPLSPYGERSAERLWDMGLRFEADGELLRAQSAYSAIRSSLYGARSFYTPGKEWIRKCDEKIASLRASMLLEEGRITKDEFGATRQKHLEVMRTDRAPIPAWAVLAAVSFIAFIASVAYFIFRGLTPEARLRKREAIIGALAAACSFALWVMSLMKA